MSKPSAYGRAVPTVCPHCEKPHMARIDVYMVLHAFGVAAHTIGHAIKKLLAPGKRSGGKSEEQDIAEAIWTLQRWQEIREAERTATATKGTPDGR